MNLERRVKQLEAALRPFAREASEWHDGIGDRYRPGLTEPRQKFAYARATFSLGDCRRAARLLGEVSK